MKEQSRQKAIIDYIQKKRGGYVTKSIISNNAGVLDLTVCYRGMYIGLEVKTPYGKVTELQAYNMERIIKAGGLAFKVVEVAEVEKILDNIDKELGE